MQRSGKTSIFGKLLIELSSLFDGVCKKDLRKAEMWLVTSPEDGG
jgi:hypothetical protein